MTSLLRSSRAVVVAALVAAVLVAGCSSSKSSKTATTETSASTASSVPATTSTGGSTQAAAVSIKDFAFHPKTVTVKVGQAVTFTNNDDVTHTATGSGGSFDTGDLGSGSSKKETFSKAGTYQYMCSIHNSMTGTIVVTG